MCNAGLEIKTQQHPPGSVSSNIHATKHESLDLLLIVWEIDGGKDPVRCCGNEMVFRRLDDAGHDHFQFQLRCNKTRELPLYFVRSRWGQIY